MDERTSIPDYLDNLPRSWGEAKATAAKWYFTGKPCPKCSNIDARRYPGGECRFCVNAKNRIRSAATADRRKAEREAARAAEQAAKKEARFALMAEEGTEVVLSREEAERFAAEEARRKRAREKAREKRLKKMAEVGTELVREQERERQREWYARTREERQAKARERRASGDAGYGMLRLRTPPWLTDEELAEIDAIYASRNREMREEVDHIVPIKDHPDIIGTHVPWNLQVLTPAQNARRQRGRINEFRCTPDEAEEYVARGMAVWRVDKAVDGRIAWSKYAPDDVWREMLEAEESYSDDHG